MQGAFKLQERQINGKKFIVPQYDLFGCQKYMLPKLQNAAVHHTFFKPQQLQDVYKQQNIDPQQLNHNLDKSAILDAQLMGSRQQYQELSPEQSDMFQEQSLAPEQKNMKTKRPPLRSEGFTHFIHIPFVEALRDTYDNKIVPRIEEQDRDLLQPMHTMHMTVMVFRLKKQEDLSKWEQVLKAAKKTRVNIRGVNIFAVKKNFGRVLYLNIKGIESLIDSVVRKAIDLELVQQQQLSFIKFDKVTEMFKSQPHITLLKTKGDDLFEFSDYVQKFNNININKINVSEIRLSVIGSYDGQDYYNQKVHVF